MQLASDRIRDLCRERGWRLGDLLEKAGVSRTAYYSLARNETVLPKSIHAMAAQLGVSPSEILADTDARERSLRRQLETVEGILRRHRGANRENVRHTLLMLDETPEERLRKGLLRGQTFDFHR
ncbi:MAG TPA: helix-turn-helix transcriptional regulator [Kiritimatiellia bacterium]